MMPAYFLRNLLSSAQRERVEAQVSALPWHHPPLTPALFLPSRRKSAFWRQLLTACLLMAGLAAASSDAADTPAFPAKPLRFVVPFPAGGPLDIAARVIAQELTRAWKQPVIIDNRPGAGGNIGADYVAKSAPDGYTIVMGAVSTHAINVSLYRKLPYDPVRDFAPVTLVTTVPNVLVVHPALPARNVRDLIGLGKARPGQLHFASGGSGSAGHLAGELFNTMTGVRMTHIPYKGAAPAVTDLLGGHVELMFDNLASALPNVQNTRLRALAVTTRQRAAHMQSIPTLDESGLRGFDIGTWFGVLAPAGTPREIIVLLNSAIVQALNTAIAQERFAALGAITTGGTPEQFGALIQAEISKYEKIVKASGASAD
jgi:tripartite-type tricarboxylate transporter receptor subunit TctC